MRNYYARFRVAGTNTPQLECVKAGSVSETKKLIAAKYGNEVRYMNDPVSETAGKPPRWYK
ncbi:MAG: hypothetical protein OXF84_04410 [Bacteroidetes bacterium]|nr:hypothetical protein [Bacteroidota bacterium]